MLKFFRKLRLGAKVSTFVMLFVAIVFTVNGLITFNNTSGALLGNYIIASVIALLVLQAMIIFLLRYCITKPVKKLIGFADRLAVGDVDFEVKTNSLDEIGVLYKSFGSMVEGIKVQTKSVENLAHGDINMTLKVRSDKDVLSYSIQTVIDTFKNLALEFEAVIEATKKGDYSIRGNVQRFEGEYASILSGVNSILEEAENAFEKINAANRKNEKQRNYMSAEIGKLISNIDRFRQGILSFDMQTAEADGDTQELYDLFFKIEESMRFSIQSIRGYIDEISSVLGEVSTGNLAIQIDSEYLGEFTELKNSINNITGSLNNIFGEITIAADQVAQGAQQVSQGNQAISQGATEQASAIEELTSTIEEIADQTKQNAVNANAANELAGAAKNDALMGNGQMKNMQQAMEDINSSSASISKIIKVIDDIAFQTNILALNAAVEAARAGVHGKGFAVVAEEVRNLAARSAEAAKETTALIEGSTQKAEAGTKIANETALSLENIVQGVDKAASLIGEIARASNDQATGIAQVNRGIEQMSSVVQNNSATAQEGAASSEELSGQAETLKGMVSQFKLKEDAYKQKVLTNKRQALPDRV